MPKLNSPLQSAHTIEAGLPYPQNMEKLRLFMARPSVLAYAILSTVFSLLVLISSFQQVEVPSVLYYATLPVSSFFLPLGLWLCWIEARNRKNDRNFSAGLLLIWLSTIFLLLGYLKAIIAPFFAIISEAAALSRDVSSMIPYEFWFSLAAILVMLLTVSASIAFTGFLWRSDHHKRPPVRSGVLTAAGGCLASAVQLCALCLMPLLRVPAMFTAVLALGTAMLLIAGVLCLRFVVFVRVSNEKE